jgi:hypothetical protein
MHFVCSVRIGARSSIFLRASIRMVIKFSESQVFVAGVCGSNLGLCSRTYGSRRMSIYECLLGEQLLNKTFKCPQSIWWSTLVGMIGVNACSFL